MLCSFKQGSATANEFCKCGIDKDNIANKEGAREENTKLFFDRYGNSEVIRGEEYAGFCFLDHGKDLNMRGIIVLA